MLPEGSSLTVISGNAVVTRPGLYHRTVRDRADRAAGTAEQIITAAAEAIAELGLRHTTMGEIGRRAGMTDGAVFHHFPTRLDLIVAVAEAVLGERVASARSVVTAPPPAAAATPVHRLSELRRLAHEPPMRVWVEVLLSARTDGLLRARLASLLAPHVDALHSLAAALPTLVGMSSGARTSWVDVVRNVLIGEAFTAGVVPGGAPQRKVELLVVLAGVLAAQPDGVPGPL